MKYLTGKILPFYEVWAKEVLSYEKLNSHKKYDDLLLYIDEWYEKEIENISISIMWQEIKLQGRMVRCYHQAAQI